MIFDQALNSARPIPFTLAEARLAEVILGCDGPFSLVQARSASALCTSQRLLFSCHGGVSGNDRSRHGYLLLDAENGRRLELADASAVAAQADEIVVSACVAGVVGRAQWGDALGLVALWQLRGVGAVVACTAPVHDFYMPVMVMLYLHNRVCRLSPDYALREAKHQFATGRWPIESIAILREIYRTQMEQILQRCAGKADDAIALSTVCDWPLPTRLKECVRAACGPDASLLQREHLTAMWATQIGRADWIEPCLDALIDRRAGRASSPDTVQRNIAAIIEHICAYTVCYGTLQLKPRE